jgi:polyhydroxyalkanoate synthesis repressor PhaR
MYLIKHYPNRKLYDTESKKYISLKEVAQLIRKGQTVTIVENTSGEDITTRILTQLIQDESFQLSSFIPHALLAELIQSGSDGFLALQQMLQHLPGLNRLVNQEIQVRITRLLLEGSITEEEAYRIRSLLVNHPTNQPDEVTGSSQEIVNKTIEAVLLNKNIPTQEDIISLINQIKELELKLEELQP